MSTSNIYTEKNINIENTTIPQVIEQIKELALPKANNNKRRNFGKYWTNYE